MPSSRTLKTAAERRADAAEEAAIRRSQRWHHLAHDVREAVRRDEAERRLDMQLRYGRSRRRRGSSRPKWTGRAR